MLTRIAVAAFTVYLVHSGGTPPVASSDIASASAQGLRETSRQAANLCMENPKLCQGMAEKALALMAEGSKDSTALPAVDLPLPPRRPLPKRS
ncbi:MAG: hypothetical protein LCH38_07310 [Proteobacteria bacterium]|nr:hypothetical protein [Pseudomonadota bacterium]